MSPVRLNGSTSGYSELSAPAVAGNITLTLPTGTGSANQFLKHGATAGALAFGTTTEDASGNLAFNSGYGSAAVAYGCRAWVNFNGTGTVAIRASGNVSSITDNGTGDYTVNFTTALADANYAVTGTAGGGSTNPNNYLTGPSTATAMSTTQFRFQVRNDAATLVDSDTIMLSVFR